MKRLDWPLQRVLDVTEQRELAARAELARLAGETRQLRAKMQRIQSGVQKMLGAFGGGDLQLRLASQDLVMGFAAVQDRQIGRLQQELDELVAERERKMAEYYGIRQRRRMLERLREQAGEEHRRQVRDAEQKQTDEAACTSFARSQRA